MATDATIDYVAFGIIVGGAGTDNTTVFSDTKQIKAMFFSGNTDDATCVIKSKDPSGAWVTVHKFMSNDTNELNSAAGNQVWFGETGSTFDGMQVNLSSTSSHLFIHVV